MKRLQAALVLALTSVASAQTATVQRWEYARLTVTKYFPTAQMMGEQYLYDFNSAVWLGGGRAGLFARGEGLSEFFYGVFERKIDKPASFLDELGFQNLIGEMGWEMVNRDAQRYQARLNGADTYIYEETFFYKRMLP